MTSVEYEMYDCSGNNWSHQISNKRFKERFGAILGDRSIHSPQKTAVLGTAHTIWKLED